MDDYEGNSRRGGRGRGQGRRDFNAWDDDGPRSIPSGFGGSGGQKSGGRGGGGGSDKKSNYQFRQGLTFEYQRPKFLQDIVGLSPAGPTIEDKRARIAGIERPHFDAEDDEAEGPSRPVPDDEKPLVADDVGGLSQEEVHELLGGGAKMTEGSRPSKSSSSILGSKRPSAKGGSKEQPNPNDDTDAIDAQTKMVFKKPTSTGEKDEKRPTLKRAASEDNADGAQKGAGKSGAGAKRSKKLLSFDVDE
ncbi:hypothetical protein M427DRAFT_158899 [Gonapodya prolifera JEL478]|uniref:DUF4604 domain-containing protein n=1 Tax=Gonapodya prolifera (strain JEL478) TaxID=1344416 RepID=A0A139A1V9_GONPJ|nr:hypothetical protein M427DRAFT_158899 [Gonapodya prolifera JEL478]|eukprot:KXS10731.1 hypothetical protein M427DRAFT_158899 [Gonapodya prolifera JEL478]